MKYYIVDYSLDEAVVGKDYPQAYKFMKGYDGDAPNGIIGLYKYDEEFPDFIPDLDGIMLSGSAKLTDVVSNGYCSDFFIVSEKVKRILEQYTLCPHRFYPLGLYKRKVKYDYYLLHIISLYVDYVDYPMSSFVEYDILSRRKYGAIMINSIDELMQKNSELDKDKGVMWAVWGDRIVMNEHFDKDTDFFTISRFDSNIYMSERLKNAIEAAGVTGWAFTPATNLIVD